MISNFQAVNADGVLVSGADNGTMYFWDWKTGYNFQRLQVIDNYLFESPYSKVIETSLSIELKHVNWFYPLGSGTTRFDGL